MEFTIVKIFSFGAYKCEAEKKFTLPFMPFVGLCICTPDDEVNVRGDRVEFVWDQNENNDGHLIVELHNKVPHDIEDLMSDLQSRGWITDTEDLEKIIELKHRES